MTAAATPKLARDIRERFMEKVEIDANGCWLWTAHVDPAGYGRFSGGGRMVNTRSAHRVGYEIFVGLIPEGLSLDHLCRVRRCVNPEHLEPVPLGENVLRGENFCAINARKTRCPNDHEYDDANTHRNARGWRKCRACARDRARAARAARR